MAKYKKALVAFDDSPASRNALKQAPILAPWIKVVAVVPDYRGDLELIGVSSIKETMEGPGRRLLDKAKKIAAENKFHILTNLEQGEPYDRIIHVARDERCDLIVVGRRGTHHLERALMGSSTAKIIGYTEKEVLVLPEKSTVDWAKLLLVTDCSHKSEAALNKALDIAFSYNIKLSILTVVDVDDEVYTLAYPAVLEMVAKAKSQHENIRNCMEHEEIDMECFVREGAIEKVVAEFAVEKDISMIIMGSHGRRGLSKVLMGSSTERVIGFSPCPVLVVHST